jgi:hypothetical protein
VGYNIGGFAGGHLYGVGLLEHEQNGYLYGRYPKNRIEGFGCWPLYRSPLPGQERWDSISLDCHPGAHIKFVVLTNMPVFLVWAVIADLTANTSLNQVRLFYSINGIGIPLLWFGIGALIDFRRSRSKRRLL